MARNIASSTDQIECVDPSGVLVIGSRRYAIGLYFRTSGSLVSLVKVGPANESAITRGICFFIDGSGLLSLYTSSDSNLGGTGTAVNDNTWRRAHVECGGSNSFTMRLGTTQTGTGASDPLTEITTGDSFSLGRGVTGIGIDHLAGDVARAWYLDITGYIGGGGAAPSAAQLDAIFDDFNDAETTYGSHLKILNRIDGSADPEPDWQTGATNALDVNGTTQVADPLGNPEDGGGGGGLSIPVAIHHYHRLMTA